LNKTARIKHIHGGEFISHDGDMIACLAKPIDNRFKATTL
jgi:hypothetical protein